MPEEEEKSGPSVIRTMQSDVQSSVQKPGTSAVSLLARRLGEKREKISQKSSSPRRQIIIAGVSIFIILASTSAALVYLNYFLPEKPPAPALETPEKLIAAEEETLDLKEFENILSHGPASPAGRPAVEKFKVIFFDLNLEEFLTYAGLKPPARLKSQIQAYNLGLFKEVGEIFPFLIFKVASFEDAFAGALLWEKNMPKEFALFFPELRGVKDFEIIFQDKVVKNQDARVLAKDGEIKLLYTFFNKELMIIAASQKTLEEIIARYAIFRPN